MPLKSIGKEEFAKLLKIKNREFLITDHASKRARKRFLSAELFKKDLQHSRPALIFEQEHDVPGERKFDVYYAQTDDSYHRYIMALNDSTRLISLMRVNRSIQRKLIGK